MSRSEGFLSRWLRRKTQSGARTQVSSLQRASAGAAGKPDEKNMTRAAPHATSEPSQAAFDPASLPSIESIVAATDIRPFLRSGVPAELTRAALRRAWISDPTVRDFIGIAENQWDFNDPTAMPGFGPLTTSDAAATAAAQMRSAVSDRLAQMTEASVKSTPAIPEAGGANGGELDNELQHTLGPSAEGALDAQGDGLAIEQNNENSADRHDSGSGENGVPRNHRSHGGALPR